MSTQQTHGWRKISQIVLTTLLLLAFLAPPAWAQEESAPPIAPLEEAATVTAASPGAADALPNCDNPPFGKLLMVGAEREIFVSYRGGFGSPHANWLAHARLDLDADGALALQESWLGGDFDDTRLTNIAHPTAAVADLDADGKVELIQALIDNNGDLSALSYGQDSGAALQQYTSGGSGGSLVAAAGGNFTRSAPRDEELVIATRSGADNLYVRLINAFGNGTLRELPAGFWWTGNDDRKAPRLLTVASADLDGDGYDDEMVVALYEEGQSYIQLVVLEYTPGYELQVTGAAAANLKEVATYRFEASRVLNLALATGDVDSDYKDEIVIGYDRERESNDGYSSVITVKTFAVDLKNQSAPIVERNQWVNPDVQSPNLALAAADTDGDGAAEVVVAYENTGQGGLTIHTLDAEAATVYEHNVWQDGSGGRSSAQWLAIDAADLNGNGQADIVAAFRDAGSKMQVVRITDAITATAGMALAGEWIDSNDGRANATGISVRIADWDNDSIKAAYAPALGGTLKCKQVVEPQLASAVFIPPYWRNIQDGQYMYGTIGRSSSRETTQETALTTSHSHSASGYFGVGAGVDAVIGSFEASVKLTAGYEYAAEETQSGSTNEGQTVSVGWLNFDNYIVADDAVYNCYQYQLTQNDQPLEGAARFCENQGVSNVSMSMDTWDLRHNIDLHWAPITRDWASLTLFRGEKAVQSSVAEGGAHLAADGDTNGDMAGGSVTVTNQEQTPWWQIDLGQSQLIEKVRVWNRTGKGCADPACAAQLADFYLFITDVDPQTISNDPAVLKSHAAVRAFHFGGVAGRVHNFKTMDTAGNGVEGRYVRIQLAGAGVLGLAEVQVLGGNHIEPDRYPVAVWDEDASTAPGGKYAPGTDGWFSVQLYNPATGQHETVRQRGNLLWNGSQYGVLQSNRVGQGDSTLIWSLSTVTETSRSTATAFSHTAKIGAEFDVEMGVGAKIMMGGSYEYATGFGRAESKTISWGSGFEIEGGMQGFPTTNNGQRVYWPDQCQYGFQPYYYEVVEESSNGYQHRFMVIDYIVPSYMLDRTRNLAPCRAGVFTTGPNTPPVAVNDAFTVTAGIGPATLDVLANDHDPNGDALTITGVTQPANGQVAIAENMLVYTPTAGFTGTDTFGYTISDGIASANGVVAVTVVPNAAPVATNDTFNVSASNGPIVLRVLDNDQDLHGRALTIASVTQPAHGEVAIAGNTVVYTPEPGFTGVVTFTYTVSNGGSETTATVTLNITTGGQGSGDRALFLPLVQR
ncbi:MAG: tandem-95 repeat protein [Caldilineaceae bacterium]|nr:tandem-95 repeat protein [Caldilineaceae bacterium]